MIVVQDDFLKDADFKQLQNYVATNEWKIFDTGKKKFSYMERPNGIDQFFEIEGHDLIMSFIRRAFKGFDNEPRIHADNILKGHRTSLASVMYLSDKKGITENGTRFYEHRNYGRELPLGISDEEYDFVLGKHSNDLSKWTITDTIVARPNRVVTYAANYFHSKWPNEIVQGQRNVLVNFYKKKE